MKKKSVKLANHLTIRLSGLFILILIVWSALYFVMQMREIYNDIDEGLTNLKQEFIVQANDDAEFVESMEKYDPINMIVREISIDEAINIKEVHSTTKVYFETEDEYEEVRILSTAFRCEDNGKYYSIEFFTSTVETDDLVKNMLILLVLLWLTLGVFLIVAGKRIISNSSKPFSELLEKLQEFSLDHTKMIDFPKTNITEFRALNKSVEMLLNENISAYNEQKTFIENASHELQTPLTIVIGKVELMMNDKNMEEKEMTELSSILANLNRMKRLNSSLLLLSKIRNKQFVESGCINVSTVVAEVLDNFEDIVAHKGLLLEVEMDETTEVKMNVDLAHIMFTNLVKNAVNYNLPNGKIKIVLTNNSFTISNDGKPIPEDMNIFERYTSKSVHNTSAGLGLSIVSTIVSVYRFKMNYSYDEMHHISILFPKKVV